MEVRSPKLCLPWLQVLTLAASISVAILKRGATPQSVQEEVQQALELQQFDAGQQVMCRCQVKDHFCTVPLRVAWELCSHKNLYYTYAGRKARHAESSPGPSGRQRRLLGLKEAVDS